MAADRGRILEILHDSAMFTDDQISAAIAQVDQSIAVARESSYIAHVAEQNGAVRGFTSHGPVPNSPGAFDLYWIAVDPRFHRRGIGRQLLQFVENEVRRSGGDTLLIETSSSEAYAPTRAFYCDNGYAAISRLKDFHRREDDKVIFCRTLS